MTECVNCVNYYGYEYCARCGYKLDDIGCSELLDIKIDIDCWYVFLDEKEYNNNQQSILISNNGGIENIKTRLTANKLIIGTNLFNSQVIPRLNIYINKKEIHTLRYYLKIMSNHKKIKLFDALTIIETETEIVYKFEQSLKVKDISDRITNICKLFNILYYNSKTDTLSTESEIRNEYKLEFEMFKLDMSILFSDNIIINGIQRHLHTAIMDKLNQFKYKRNTKYVIFKELTMQKDPNEVMMKIMGFTQL